MRANRLAMANVPAILPGREAAGNSLSPGAILETNEHLSATDTRSEVRTTSTRRNPYRFPLDSHRGPSTITRQRSVNFSNQRPLCCELTWENLSLSQNHWDTECFLSALLVVLF